MDCFDCKKKTKKKKKDEMRFDLIIDLFDWLNCFIETTEGYFDWKDHRTNNVIIYYFKNKS